jgi:uncharacterized protein YndB with AHSA1/START domain
MLTTTVTLIATPAKVWEYFTNPVHVKNWNNASPDWHTPNATNDLQIGGKFNYTMAAKDGSVSFDFWGIYTLIQTEKAINYTLGDDRKVNITFTTSGNQVTIVQAFEPETENTEELQQQGWQAILNNFAMYVANN